MKAPACALAVLGPLVLSSVLSGNPIPVPMPAQMPLEDMVIVVQPVPDGLHADFCGDFTFTYIPPGVTGMMFPVPPGSTDIGVEQDGVAEPWGWSSELYPTVLPELPWIPMIEWAGPFPAAGAVFTVTYAHDLIERPDEFIYFYALGTGKYFPTYDKTTTALVDVLLPPDYTARGVWLDDTPHPYDLDSDHLLILVESHYGPIIHDLIVSLVPKPTGDYNRDGAVDADDVAPFAAALSGPCPDPLCRPSLYGTMDDGLGDFDLDGDLDLVDFAELQRALTVPPRLTFFGDSGCLPGIRGEGGDPWAPCPDDDEIEVTVAGNEMHVCHLNADYNCCPDAIVVALTVEGTLLRFREDEVGGDCDCVCCYAIESTVAGLGGGAFTVEYCWFDYGLWADRCETRDVVIP